MDFDQKKGDRTKPSAPAIIPSTTNDTHKLDDKTLVETPTTVEKTTTPTIKSAEKTATKLTPKTTPTTITPIPDKSTSVRSILSPVALKAGKSKIDETKPAIEDKKIMVKKVEKKNTPKDILRATSAETVRTVNKDAKPEKKEKHKEQPSHGIVKKTEMIVEKKSKRNDTPLKSERSHKALESLEKCKDISADPVTKSNTPSSVEEQSQNANLQTSAGGDGSISPTTGTITMPVASIPENILSPPKSETQTDETNTATSSSSPASSTSQLSPITEPVESVQTPTTTAGASLKSPGAAQASKSAVKALPMKKSRTTTTTQPINVVANGTIPKSGKPFMATMNPKCKPARSVRPRKQKAMYESEISDNKIGIKLCIKKSDATTPTSPSTSPSIVSVTSPTAQLIVAITAPVATSPGPMPAIKQIRKRSRKSKTKPRLDSDDSEYETKRRRAIANNGGGDRQKKVSFSGVANDDKRGPSIEQTDWGAKLPEEILYKIFQLGIENEGCLPTLLRLGRVCTLWRRVSLSPLLWRSLDLSTWIKEKYRTEVKLKWFVDNRCSSCKELNVSNWKVSDINCFLDKLATGCTNLEGITLSGWKNFTTDHLTYLVDNMKKLKRLDLSSVNVEMNASKSAVGLQSLCNALQTMNGRLTHLYLAHNRLAGIPQIVNILSKYCPNLVLLDLSNVTTQATSHGIMHIEKLQHGCQKLRVLRVTNSHITPSIANMQEMMDSPGFPALEELSVAVLDESRIIGDEHLQRILKTSSKLKLLDVRGCARLTHESLIRLPAWDIKHLFLSGCSVTRDVGSGLELIASKWAHSLIELDLAWANVQQPIDNALRSLAEKGSDSPLAHLNLCGSSVSEDAVKDILANCALMNSINLSSCRGLPRGVKRLMQGPQELKELRDVLKVQMKVKLMTEREKEAADAAAKKSTDDDGTDGDGGGCNSQSN